MSNMDQMGKHAHIPIWRSMSKTYQLAERMRNVTAEQKTHIIWHEENLALSQTDEGQARIIFQPAMPFYDTSSKQAMVN